MTISELSTLLPPPEGMEWRPDGAVGFKCCSNTLDGRIIVINPAYPTLGVHWSVTAENDEEAFASRGVTLADLPAAYLRALTAVGLAPDEEKEDLRRRLTWTSEVPTEPGVYVVGRGVKPYDGSIMFRRWDEDEGKMERPWVDAFGLPWTDEQMKGRRFFALDNLKETR